MNQLDRPSVNPHDEGVNYWARIEAKSDTMSADLLRDTVSDEEPPAKNLRREIGFGIAIYIALAAAVALLCLRCDLTSSPTYDASPSRLTFFEPKF